MTPTTTEAISPPIWCQPGTAGTNDDSTATTGSAVSVQDVVGSTLMIEFKILDSPTEGAHLVRLSDQLENYIAAAGTVLRPSTRIDKPLGVEPDDYPVR